MFCREQVVQLHHEIAALRAAGVELAVVGNGTPNFMAGFRETTGYTGALYTDPSLVVYKLAGLRRRLAVTPGMALSALRALSKGHLQGRTQGDALQLGGVFVVSPTKGLMYAQVSDVAGDHAPVADVLAAARRATA